MDFFMPTPSSSLHPHFTVAPSKTFFPRYFDSATRPRGFLFTPHQWAPRFQMSFHTHRNSTYSQRCLQPQPLHLGGFQPLHLGGFQPIHLGRISAHLELGLVPLAHPKEIPLEIPVKEVIKEGNSLCLGPHQGGFTVTFLFPLPLLWPCAGGVPEQIPGLWLPAEPQVHLPLPVWRELSPVRLPGESSTPRVS